MNDNVHHHICHECLEMSCSDYYRKDKHLASLFASTMGEKGTVIQSFISFSLEFYFLLPLVELLVMVDTPVV